MEYLSVEEVARKLHVCRQTIYKWITAKKIKSHKVNGRILFIAQEIEAMVQNSMQ